MDKTNNELDLILEITELRSKYKALEISAGELHLKLMRMREILDG